MAKINGNEIRPGMVIEYQDSLWVAVKTMAVKPPMGLGKVRLIEVKGVDRHLDLQACGGTHVKQTGEIGPVVVRKIENKGRQNRRVNIEFAA